MVDLGLLHELLLVRSVHLGDLVVFHHGVPLVMLVVVLVELVHVIGVVGLAECCLWSGQHEVVLVLTRHALPEFFDPVGVPESVESVFAAGDGGGYVAHHDTLALPPYEGVFQNQSQFVLPERNVGLVHV